MEEKKQWDLTEAEVTRLEVVESKALALQEMMKALNTVAEASVALQLDWWTDLKARLNMLPYRRDLIAEPKLKKAWIRGQVSELDNQIKYDQIR